MQQGTILAQLHRSRLFFPVISLLFVASIARMYYWPATHGLDVTGYQIGRDFINNWVGPQLAFGGHFATLFDFKAYHAALGTLFGQPLPFHNWGYPLFTLFAFWPLAQLPYFWALAAWTGGLFAIFAAVILSQISQSQRAYALLALALAPACLINAIGGQNGFLSAALLLGGMLNVERRPLLSGLLFGLLTFKPHLGLVVPFVLITLRAWRAIMAAAVTTSLLVAATIPLFGIEAWRDYIEITGSYQTLLLHQFHGFYTVMMASLYAGGRTLGLSYAAAMAIQVTVAVPTIIAACYAVRRTDDPCRRAMVVACATMLVTPYAFNYDLTAIAAVLVWMLSGRLPWRPEFNAVYLLAWIAPAAMMYLNMLGLGILPLAMLALYVIAVREAVSDHTEAASDPTPAADVPVLPAELATAPGASSIHDSHRFRNPAASWPG